MAIKSSFRVLSNEEQAEYEKMPQLNEDAGTNDAGDVLTGKTFAPESDVDDVGYDIEVDEAQVEALKSNLGLSLDEDLKINPIDDHQEKYNLDVDDANKKMLDLYNSKKNGPVDVPGNPGSGMQVGIVGHGVPGAGKLIDRLHNDKVEVIGIDLATQPDETAMINMVNGKALDIDEAIKVVGQNSAIKNEDTYYDEKSGRVLHKKTKKQYEAIWSYFLEYEAKDFERIMGYGKKIIKKIGYKKFIDAMDWNNTKQIASYKTDRMHIVPCPHCKSEFGVYEEDCGLCASCKPQYDMPRFWSTYKAAGEAAGTMPALFYSQADFRNKYKIKTPAERTRDMVEEKFDDVETFRFIMELIPVAVAEKITLDEFKENFYNSFMKYIKKDSDKELFDKFYNEVLVEGFKEFEGKDWYNNLINIMHDRLQKKHNKEIEAIKATEQE